MLPPNYLDRNCTNLSIFMQHSSDLDFYEEIGELDVLSCRSLALNPAALLTRCMVKSSPSMFIEDLKYKVSTNNQYATVLLWDEPYPKPVECSQPLANPVQRGSTATELD